MTPWDRLTFGLACGILAALGLLYRALEGLR